MGHFNLLGCHSLDCKWPEGRDHVCFAKCHSLLLYEWGKNLCAAAQNKQPLLIRKTGRTPSSHFHLRCKGQAPTVPLHPQATSSFKICPGIISLEAFFHYSLARFIRLSSMFSQHFGQSFMMTWVTWFYLVFMCLFHNWTWDPWGGTISWNPMPLGLHLNHLLSGVQAITLLEKYL